VDFSSTNICRRSIIWKLTSAIGIRTDTIPNYNRNSSEGSKIEHEEGQTDSTSQRTFILCTLCKQPIKRNGRAILLKEWSRGSIYFSCPSGLNGLTFRFRRFTRSNQFWSVCFQCGQNDPLQWNPWRSKLAAFLFWFQLWKVTLQRESRKSHYETARYGSEKSKWITLHPVFQLSSLPVCIRIKARTGVSLGKLDVRGSNIGVYLLPKDVQFN